MLGLRMQMHRHFGGGLPDKLPILLSATALSSLHFMDINTLEADTSTN